ncbi:MAG: hypothetical protein AB4372_36610, partial [Xenococcus sp. (in: cyanobacteria)]
QVAVNVVKSTSTRLVVIFGAPRSPLILMLRIAWKLMGFSRNPFKLINILKFLQILRALSTRI